MAEYQRVLTFSVVVVILAAAAVTADSTARRKIPTRNGGFLSEESIEEYLEDQITKEEPTAENASPLQIYLHLLRMKRKEQVETVEKVLSLDDFSQQYKIVTTLLETLFPEVKESIGNIEKAGFTPGAPFPENRDLQEEVGKVYENVLMFGDFLLRMPEITRKVYETRKEWTGLFRWALKFCLESRDVFNGPYATHLHLMMQELGIGPKDPNYTNPFSNRQHGKTVEENVKDRIQSKREAMQEKMKNMKGPKLRTNRHHEL